MAQFQQWRNAVRTEVAAASGWTVVAYPWFLEAEKWELEDPRLRDSGPYFSSLDMKLGSAIQRLAKGELGRKIYQAFEEQIKQQKVLTGRHCFAIVCRYSATDKQVQTLYGITDLISLRLKSDQNIEVLDIWLRAEGELRGQVPIRDVEEIFLRQLRTSAALKSEVDHYDRSPDGSHEHSYNFLLERVKAHIKRKRLVRNRDDQANMLGGLTASAKDSTQGQARASPPAKGAGKAKGGKGGKGNKAKDDKTKDVPCSFHAKGTCRKGRECPYSHSKQAAPASANPEKRGCYAKSRGDCKKGADCPYAHRRLTSNEQTARDSGSKGKGQSKSGAPSSSSAGKGRGEPKGPLPECRLPKEGRCNSGDKCKFSHSAAGKGARPSAPAATPAVCAPTVV